MSLGVLQWLLSQIETYFLQSMIETRISFPVRVASSAGQLCEVQIKMEDHLTAQCSNDVQTSKLMYIYKCVSITTAP